MIKRANSILIEDNEVKPNKYVARLMLFTAGIFILMWIFVIIGIFELDPLIMIKSVSVSIMFLLIPEFLCISKEICSKYFTKYILLTCSIICTAVVVTTLYFHTVICILFPLFIAMQYKNKKVALIAIASSLIISFICPILYYKLGFYEDEYVVELLKISRTYDTDALNTISSELASFTDKESVLHIILYISLPSFAITLGFSTLCYAVVKGRINCIKNQIAVQEFSERDYLTGLYNQSYYQSVIDSSRTEENIGVIFMDVDGLKQANDTNGHEYGDLLLKRSAEAIKRIENENVLGFRLGGDEFLVIAECKDEKDFDEVLSRLDESIYNINLENTTMYGGLKCSMSKGTSYGKYADLTRLVREADNIMYDNKRKSKITHNN